MSKADIVVGIQWGDEGKGRVVDSYATGYDLIARFGGGDNAGHTIVVGDRKLALRVVPERRAAGPAAAALSAAARCSGSPGSSPNSTCWPASASTRAHESLGPRARRLPVPRHGRRRRRAGARRRCDRHDRARDRPGIHRQGRAARAAPSATCASPMSSRAASRDNVAAVRAAYPDGAARRRGDPRRGARARRADSAARRRRRRVPPRLPRER